MVVVAIIFVNSCFNPENKNSGTPCIETKIDSLDKNDQLIIFNDYFVYKFKENEFTVEPDEISNLPVNSSFLISVNHFKDEIGTITNAKISIKINSKVFIGHGIPSYSSYFPPLSNFYYILDDHGSIRLKDGKSIGCISSEFLSIEDYQKKVLGIAK